MNIKQINQEVAKWQMASHDIKNDDRESFINLVKIGGGDHYYAKDCTKAQALTQVRLALEDLEWYKNDIKKELEA